MSASEKELGSLHAVVATFLKDKLSGGEASASDVSNAIKFLKDNSITCAPDENSDLDELAKKLNTASASSPVDKEDLTAALEQLDFTGMRIS